MIELEQLDLILGPETSYGVEDGAESFTVSTPDGMRIEVTEGGGEYRWRVTHPVGTGYESSGPFHSRRAAKDDLRKALVARRAALRNR